MGNLHGKSLQTYLESNLKGYEAGIFRTVADAQADLIYRMAGGLRRKNMTRYQKLLLRAMTDPVIGFTNYEQLQLLVDD